MIAQEVLASVHSVQATATAKPRAPIIGDITQASAAMLHQPDISSATRNHGRSIVVSTLTAAARRQIAGTAQANQRMISAKSV